MTKFHKGPPPSLGWWPTYVNGCRSGYLRWWNDEYWSACVSPYEDAALAAESAGIKSIFITDDIQWAHRPESWPKRSRT